jgi:hypothetical protein
LGGASACGASDDSTGSAAPPDIGVVTNDLLAGSTTNVTLNNAPNSLRESETDAVTLGTGTNQVVAYNAPDTVHVSGSPTRPNICRYRSEEGVSYFTNGTWRSVGIGVPFYDGVSLLLGDPGITALDVGSSWQVYVNSLALSDAAWGSLPKLSDGCVDPDDFDESIESGGIDRMCVQLLTIPKNGGALTGGLSNCVGTDSYDGGQIYATPTGNVYLATWNLDHNSIDVYKNFGSLTRVFAGGGGHKMMDHPLIIPGPGGAPSVIAPDSTGHFWMTLYSESNSTWSTPVQIASGFVIDQDSQFKNGTSLREIGYTATWADSPGSLLPALYFFYETPEASGVKRVQGVLCLYNVGTISCAALASWITPAGVNAFMPTVASANVNGTERDWLSYWSDRGGASGALTLTFTNFTLTSFGSPVFTPAVQQPCPQDSDFGNYWGDYDKMTVLNDGTSSPSLRRYVTDSTSGTCNTTTGLPQHVSSYLFTGL